MRTFDEWIRKGLHQTRKRLGSAWDEAYDTAPTTRFLFLGRGRQAPNALLGVLQPSRDRKGRTYPFTITSELPKATLRGAQSAYLPLQAEQFYTSAERIVQEAVDGSIPYREVTDRVAEIDPGLALNASPPMEYERFTQQTLEAFLESLFDHFEDSRKYRLFNNLLDILLPQRDRPNPRLNYGLQFPLGDEGNPHTTTACFWLDVSRHLLDHPDADISFFWTSRAPTSNPTFLLLFLGAPRASAFFHRLTSENDTQEIFKLESMGSENGAQAALSIPEAYGSLLENRELHLQDFLQHL